MAISPRGVVRSTSCLVLRWGFLGRRIEWRYFRFRQIKDGGSATILENSNGDISAADRPIYSVWFYDGVFGVGGSNGANSFLTKFNRYVGENNARGIIRLVTIKYFLYCLLLYTLDVDNQIVFVERQEVISAGNFHGEYPAKVRYLEVITRLFSYRHVYQARASITARDEVPRAVVDRGLDIGADMKVAV